MASSNTVSWSEVHHALVAYLIEGFFEYKLRPKKVWKCSDQDACLDAMASMEFHEDSAVESVLERVSDYQEVHSERQSCSQRRRERMPFELRNLYAQISRCSDVVRLAQLRKLAWERRKKWIHELKLRARIRCLAQGRVLQRSGHLHKLETMKIDGVASRDCEEWAQAVSRHYGQKWGCHCLQGRANLLDYIRRFEGCALHLDSVQVSQAFRCLKNRNKNDRCGVSVAGLEMLYVAQPDVFNSWLASLLGGAERFASLTVWAFICGKESGNTTVEKTRVIMPMPALLNIIDALLVVLLEPFLETLLVVPGSCWIGGRKYTQVLDITHGLTAVIEKSMDLESAGAVAQADIQQYYD